MKGLSKLFKWCEFPEKKPKSDPTTLPTKREHKFIDKILSANDSDVGSTSKFDPRLGIKYGTNAEAVKGIITEYCNDSTTHGFKYIGDHRRPIIERIIWTLALTISIYFCCYSIKTNWEKNYSRPFIIVSDEKLTSVSDIPFPTVTICPETKTNPQIFNYTDVIRKFLDNRNYKLTSEEEYFMEVVAQMCPEHRFAILYLDSKEKSTVSGFMTRNISDLIASISPIFDDIISLTEWQEVAIMDRSNYQKVITEEGVCYSFNSLDARAMYRQEALVEGTYFDEDNERESEWGLESGFNSTPLESYPFRAFSSGARSGLYLWLTGNTNISDYFCQGPFQGFKLIISTPGEVPQVSSQFLSIPFSQRVSISIKPHIVTSTEEIRQYEPERRQCYFQDERYLKYFQTYTQANCELECLSNITLATCGCVKFHMPRTDSVQVCGLGDYLCVFRTQKAVLWVKTAETFLDSNITSCNCLPTCVTIRYDAELETISSLESYSLNNLFNRPNINKETHLTISFKEKAFNALIRSERYTLTDFIASCGGILGLFMGASILSLVELLSFLTIRLWINLRIRRKKHLEMKRLQEPNAGSIDNEPTV